MSVGVVQPELIPSSQEVARLNKPGDGVHSHKFLPAVVKLDLIISPSADKIKLWRDSDQFQVKFLLLSIPQSKKSPLSPWQNGRRGRFILLIGLAAMMCWADLCAIKYECATLWFSGCSVAESFCLISVQSCNRILPQAVTQENQSQTHWSINCPQHWPVHVWCNCNKGRKGNYKTALTFISLCGCQSMKKQSRQGVFRVYGNISEISACAFVRR